jgi:NADH-quinone oxidoreductase subunit N
MIFTPDSVAGLQLSILEDLRRLAPEVVLIGSIVTLLFFRMLSPTFHLGLLALAGAMTACAAWLAPHVGLWPPPDSGPAFTGLLHLDALSTFLRGLLVGFLLLFVILTRLTSLPDSEDAADFYTLVFGLILGLMLMTTANHFLTIFLGIEMASLPGYALAGFLKGRRNAGEAAMKYVLYGAAASGVMLYGMSLLAVSFSTMSPSGMGMVTSPLALMGWACIGIGLLFKLGAVPLHFWLPDVLEGSCAEVGAVLSTASKIGAFGLVARVISTMPTHDALRWLLIGIATLTMTWGNLAAYRQTNLKRLFAYSTIAHAGTLFLAIATLRPGLGLMMYLLAYAVMNLGVFATISLVRNATGSENLDALRGLFQRSPSLAIGFALCVFSLLGLPPLAGFLGKFMVFQDVYFTGLSLQQTGHPLGLVYFALLGIAVLNTVLGAGYYLKLLKLAFLEPADGVPPIPASRFVLLLGLALIVLGILGDRLLP